MDTHTLDETAAGKAAEALQTQMLGFLEMQHPDDWRELADTHLVPMSNSLDTRGSKWAGAMDDAERAGRELTAHDVVVVAWSYLVEAIHKNRGAQPVESVWQALAESKFYLGVAVGRANTETHGERVAASLFDAIERKAEIIRRHAASESDDFIGASLHITPRLVRRIRTGK